MPIYEYGCSSCEKVTEAIQKFSDPPLTTCPACGGTLSRLMSRTSFQLKGGGWYATDYKKPAAAPSTSSDSGSKPSGGGDKPSGGGSES
jgi:putative FmdB family regulatory protein